MSWAKETNPNAKPENELLEATTPKQWKYLLDLAQKLDSKIPTVILSLFFIPAGDHEYKLENQISDYKLNKYELSKLIDFFSELYTTQKNKLVNEQLEEQEKK